VKEKKKAGAGNRTIEKPAGNSAFLETGGAVEVLER